MGKRKKRISVDDDVHNEEEEVVVEPEPKKSKKKRRSLDDEENGYEERNGNVAEDTSDPEPQQQKRKKKKKIRNVNESDEDRISDIENHYVKATRAKVDENDKPIPVSGKYAKLDTKVFNIPEEEWDKKDPLNMPPIGILNENNVPFHHAYPYPLLKHHARRLLAHGIIIKTSPFSPSEDEQLIKNWRRFAKKFNVEFEDAPLYCGWAKHLDERHMAINKFHKDRNFYPYMCRGLLDRCAIQVYRRCYRIFDPKYDGEFQRTIEKDWTAEDEQELRRLHALEGNAWQKIAVKLQRNRFQVQMFYERVLMGKKGQHDTIYKNTKVLYIKDDKCRTLVYEYAKEFLPGHPVQLVINGIGEREDRNINWYRLCENHPALTIERCTEEWTRIKAQLRAAYNRVNDSSVSFIEIEQSVFEDYRKKLPRLRPTIVAKSFKILVELAEETQRRLAEEDRTLELYDIDTFELTRRLQDADITFRTSYTVGSHILRTANKILNKLRLHGFLQVLPYDFTTVDLIKMLAYFMKKSYKRIRLTKIDCHQFIHRYLRRKGIKPNAKYIVLSKKELQAIQDLPDTDVEDSSDDDDDRNEENAGKDGEESDNEDGNEITKENEASDDGTNDKEEESEDEEESDE